jgi:hypothetical protein
MRRIVAFAVFVALVSASAGAGAPPVDRTLDGSGNNPLHPDWGQSNTQYLRVAPANYADGRARPVGGPPSRFVSNRIFNDVHNNVFSENRISHWGFTWGQFMDHTFGLRQEVGGENAPIAFNASDPLEEFVNDFGAIGFTRTPAAPGTGVVTPRQQINTVSSYIDAWTVYGGTDARLEWMREGPVDGNMANNGARLLLQNGFLPRRDARGNPNIAPEMALMGRLVAAPARAVVAGDVRANENIALTAAHTLFAREHNRIVDSLPFFLSEEEKFQIARRVVGAEQQFITYEEFLPSLGVTLAPYHGYDPNVNATLSNEFAVVGYRAHSMIHGDLEPHAPAGTYTAAELAAFQAQGIGVKNEEGQTVLVIPLNLAFGNPDLLTSVGLKPVLVGLTTETQYANDEMIDNQLRSVLFEVPVAGNPQCLDGPTLPQCFRGVVDLGAIDIERGRDHGMPFYNALRSAYGLAPKTSFTAITGESTDRFPADPEINPLDPINDPDIMDFIEVNGQEVRRTTVAARLRAIYGSVNRIDAFVGMVAERHLPGTEFGELQLAIWKKQFEALRDGDRFFYLHDPVLPTIEALYGVTYRHTLAEIIELNTDVDVQPNVFEVP